MIFPLEHLQAMERKYPGVIEQTINHPYDWLVFWNSRGVDPIHRDGLRSLFYWKHFKVVYSFDDLICREIHDSRGDLYTDIPVSAMRHLPYPCIAIKTSPFTIKDFDISFSFLGHGYIWYIDNRLYTTWELHHSHSKDEYNYTHAYVDLKDDLTLYDCFDQAVLEDLKINFKPEEVDTIIKIYGGKPFSKSTYTDYIRYALNDAFGEKRLSTINVALHRAYVQIKLLEVAISFILYLNCTNADIEDAEEKLKDGSWSSLLGGKPDDYVSHKARRNALRDGQDVRAFDVGYRIASNFNRGLSGINRNASPSGDNSTITNRGYSRRRAHYHHYWIGPRDGVIAENIMSPGPGERGLVLKWLEATEIHPELRDDQAIVVPVTE